MFKKVVTIASVTALLATATVPAFAYDRGHRGGHHGGGGGGNGAAVALGVLGAFAVGAAILSATQPAPPPPVAYVPAPAYYPPPAYYAPQPQAYYAPQPQAYYPPQSYESYAYDGSSHPWEPVRQ